MRSIKITGWLLMLLVLQGCLGHFAFKEHAPNYELQQTISKLSMDNAHYTLYVHRRYTYNNQLLNPSLLRMIAPASFVSADSTGNSQERYNAVKTLKNNLNPALKIIEIEYLFVSKATGSVLYISTIADRYQQRYNSAAFLGANHPNAADFRIFMFGREDPANNAKFIFYNKDGKHTDLWTFSKEPDNSLVLHLIEAKKGGTFDDTYLLDDAFPVPMIFEPVHANDWDIEYRKAVSGTVQKLPTDALSLGADGKGYLLLYNFDLLKVTFANKYIIYDPTQAGIN